MDLLAIGCSYRTTPVEVRERLAFSDEQVGRALDQLANRQGFEAVILSTCNPVEIYLAAPTTRARDVSPHVIGVLVDFHGLSREEIRQHLYVHQQQDAARHLFRVAASLDSLVVGEGQIAGQVKKAYERALASSSTGPMLNALFPHARQVARRV